MHQVNLPYLPSARHPQRSSKELLCQRVAKEHDALPVSGTRFDLGAAATHGPATDGVTTFRSSRPMLVIFFWWLAMGEKGPVGLFVVRLWIVE